MCLIVFVCKMGTGESLYHRVVVRVEPLESKQRALRKVKLASVIRNVDKGASLYSG